MVPWEYFERGLEFRKNTGWGEKRGGEMVGNQIWMRFIIMYS